MTPTSSDEVVERPSHPHEPNIPPTHDDPEQCEACKLFGAQHQLIDTLTKERDAWKAHKLSDDEAQVISQCVKALDAFTEPVRAGYGNTTTFTKTESVRRVLDYLAHRYGVTQQPDLYRLVEQLTERLNQPQQTAVWPGWQPVGTFPTPGVNI